MLIRPLSFFFDCMIINNKMGTSSSKTIAQQLRLNDEDWQYLTIQHNQQIVKHRWKDIQGQVEVIASDPLYSIEDEMEIYHYRKEQERTLVQVYCAEYLKSSQATMCGNQQNIKVIYERIPYRLRDLPYLTFPQAIYVLSESLRGFKECYDKVGSFQLNDRMIGLNKEGSVKVWLNENFSSNHPQVERPALQITASSAHKSSASKEESAFVKNIVEMIRGKLEERKFPVEFERMLKEASGFYETYSVIERYCKEKNVWVPDRIVYGRKKGFAEESRVFEQQRPAEIGFAQNQQQKSRYVAYPFVNYGNSTPTKQNPAQFQPQPQAQLLNSPYTPYRYIQPIDLSDYRPSPVPYKPI